MIEAVVQTGSFETAYRRAGAGPAVVLLAGAGEAESWDWVFRGLAERFRVIAPVLPARGVDGDEAMVGGGLDGWLRGLIDGLGLERPALVAGVGDGAALLRFMALDPHRVARLAFVQPLGARARRSFHVVLDDASADPRPVLVVGLPGPAHGDGRRPGLERLVRFLSPSR